MPLLAPNARRHVATALAALASVSSLAAQPASRPATDTLPLATPRTLRFTTDEGTWISVDVSPDGKTLVFDL